EPLELTDLLQGLSTTTESYKKTSAAPRPVSGRSRQNRRNCPSPPRTHRACSCGSTPRRLWATAFSPPGSPYRLTSLELAQCSLPSPRICQLCRRGKRGSSRQEG